jgi:hypothetical protein
MGSRYFLPHASAAEDSKHGRKSGKERAWRSRNPRDQRPSDAT